MQKNATKGTDIQSLVTNAAKIFVLRVMFAICVITSLFSCTPEEKSAGPVIVSVVTTGQEHGDGAHAIAGKTSHIEVTSEDDRQLREIQCTYHHTGEFHSHAMHGGGLIPAFRAPNIGEWTEVKNKDIDGTFDQSTLKFSVPQHISGAWSLTTAVIDYEGFVAYHEMNVIVENDSIPAILPVSTSPAANAEGIIEINTGESFTINGNILDENYIESIVIHASREGQTIWEEAIMPDNMWMYNMSQLQIPAFTNPGLYEFKLEVTDKLGWKNWVVASVSVKNP